MKDQLTLKLDNLSKTLGEEAKSIPVEARKAETALRPELLKALRNWQESSFDLGRILCAYRETYRATGDRSWMISEEAIATTVGYNARTLRRWMERYREAIKLPGTVRHALKLSGIDPMKATSGKIVADLIQLIGSNSAPSENEATDLVAETQAGHTRSKDVVLTKEQRRLWKARRTLRTIMSHPSTTDKLGGIIAALEQELFHVWGMRAPIDVTICPHSGPFTIDGLLKKRVANSGSCVPAAKEAA